MRDTAPVVSVIVDESATARDVEDVQQLLVQHGLESTVEASYPEAEREEVSWSTRRREGQSSYHYHIEEPAWTVLINADVNALAETLGAENLRDMVEEIRSTRARQTDSSPGSGLVFLVDEETGVRMDLEFQLPLKAYSDLNTLRLSTFVADPLRFHRKSGPEGAWRAPN